MTTARWGFDCFVSWHFPWEELARPEKARLPPSAAPCHLPPAAVMRGQAARLQPRALCPSPSVDTGCVVRTTTGTCWPRGVGPGLGHSLRDPK